MSDWWKTSDGDEIDTKSGEYDTGGGDFEVIPNRTNAIASIASAAWAKDRAGNRYINIQWAVEKPEAYANRRVFQKLWCDDDDPRAKDPAKKRDKAKQMLAAIDANAGGKLAKAGREPDDDDLALALTNKAMGVTIMVWELDAENGEKLEGNWISAVWKKGTKELSEPEKQERRTKPASSSRKARNDFDEDLDDEIPF